MCAEIDAQGARFTTYMGSISFQTDRFKGQEGQSEIRLQTPPPDPPEHAVCARYFRFIFHFGITTNVCAIPTSCVCVCVRRRG